MASRTNTRTSHPDQRHLWRDATDALVLRDAVAALKRAVEAAYYFSRDEDASDAHSDLVTAEWRLRRAEARHG
jgi:hypothetical protein